MPFISLLPPLILLFMGHRRAIPQLACFSFFLSCPQLILSPPWLQLIFSTSTYTVISEVFLSSHHIILAHLTLTSVVPTLLCQWHQRGALMSELLLYLSLCRPPGILNWNEYEISFPFTAFSTFSRSTPTVRLTSPSENQTDMTSRLHDSWQYWMLFIVLFLSKNNIAKIAAPSRYVYC